MATPAAGRFGRAEVVAGFTDASYLIFSCVSLFVEAAHCALEGPEARSAWHPSGAVRPPGKAAHRTAIMHAVCRSRSRGEWLLYPAPPTGRACIEAAAVRTSAFDPGEGCLGKRAPHSSAPDARSRAGTGRMTTSAWQSSSPLSERGARGRAGGTRGRTTTTPRWRRQWPAFLSTSQGWLSSCGAHSDALWQSTAQGRSRGQLLAASCIRCVWRRRCWRAVAGERSSRLSDAVGSRTCTRMLSVPEDVRLRADAHRAGTRGLGWPTSVVRK